MRVGIVGAGGIARVHLQALKALGVESVVYSRRPQQAALLAGDSISVASSYEDLLVTTDLVVIATPPVSHLPLIRGAMAVGRDVLCEKPLGLSPREVWEIMAIVDESSATLWPAHVVRFDPAYCELRALVTDGAIGDPIVTELVRRTQAPRQGSWFLRSAESGGLIGDLMIHDIDFASWVFGEVRRVFARQSNHGSISARVTLEHASGASSLIVGDWVQSSVDLAFGYSCLGTAGSASYSSSDPTTARFWGAEARAFMAETREDRFLRPYVEQLSEVLREQSDRSKETRVTPLDALRAAEVVEAAHTSLDSGRWVSVAA